MKRTEFRGTGIVGALVLAAGLLGVAGPAASAENMVRVPPDQIKPLMSGATIEYKHPRNGNMIRWTFRPDGTLDGEALQGTNTVGGDKGKWFTSGFSGSLCFQWKKWFRGRKPCRILLVGEKGIQTVRPGTGKPSSYIWEIRDKGRQTAQIIAALRSGGVAMPQVAAAERRLAPRAETKPAPGAVAMRRALEPNKSSDSFGDIHFGTYHALVIGNNRYRHLQKLKSARNDADAVSQMLRDEYGFKVSKLTDATRSQILGTLAEYRAKLKADDNLLIYYAGHGVVDNVTETGYWLPVDAEQQNPANWISNADLTNMLRAIRAKHVMVVADSCYSGTLVRAASVKLKTARDRRVWVKRMLSKRGRTALVSGGLEPVTDSGGGNHSVFAKAFLSALRANPDVMEGQALFDRIKRPVVLNANQTPRFSDIRFAGHEGGEFMFVRRPSR